MSLAAMCMVFGGVACLFAAGWGQASPTVHIIYAVPSDRDANPHYGTPLVDAITHVQGWYREQLGTTFMIAPTSPQTCKLAQITENYVGANGWDRVIADLQHCAPVGYLAQWDTWVIYADVDPPCGDEADAAFELGRGGNGITILHRGDLNGVSLEDSDTYAPCDWLRRGQDGWFGGLAHELGHAFGLGHPEGGDESLMWTSWYYYPDTFLNDADKAYLAEFFVNPMLRCERYGYVEWCENNWHR